MSGQHLFFDLILKVYHQIYSGKAPFYTVKNEFTIIRKIGKGERPSENDHPGVPTYLWDIITLCWSQNAKDRPSMVEVVRRLTSIQRAPRSRR